MEDGNPQPTWGQESKHCPGYPRPHGHLIRLPRGDCHTLLQYSPHIEAASVSVRPSVPHSARLSAHSEHGHTTDSKTSKAFPAVSAPPIPASSYSPTAQNFCPSTEHCAFPALAFVPAGSSTCNAFLSTLGGLSCPRSQLTCYLCSIPCMLPPSPAGGWGRLLSFVYSNDGREKL